MLRNFPLGRKNIALRCDQDRGMGSSLVNMKETSRRRITVTSSSIEISTDQLGFRLEVGGGGGVTLPLQPFLLVASGPQSKYICIELSMAPSS
jgi:hypothetical protein